MTHPLPIILLLLLSCAPALTATETLLGEACLARYDPGSEERAHLAIEEADALITRLSRDLGIELDDRAEITICQSHRQLEAEANGKHGTWVRGLAMPSQGRVIVKELSEASFRDVVRHEIAHLFIGAALGDHEPNAPRWLHEGGAKYYADDWSAADAEILAAAAREGNLNTIADLADFPSDPAGGSVAYAQSFVLVDHLLALGGQQGLSEFILHYRETDDVFRAIRRAYGLSESEAETSFRDEVLRRSAEVRRPWVVEGTIFLAMVLIFAFAYWRVRRRSREIRERMEQEELMEQLMGDMRFPRIPPDELMGENQNPSDDSTSGTS